MLHLHFGCGKLGLGLVAPYLKTAESELFLLNRSAPSTVVMQAGDQSAYAQAHTLNSTKRNSLLQAGGGGFWVSNGSATARTYVAYNGFSSYHDDDIVSVINRIVQCSQRSADGVIITASLVYIEHYAPIVLALQTLCKARDHDPDRIGEIYFIACENMFNANDVLAHPAYHALLSKTHERTICCVDAIVDRICSRLDIFVEEGQEHLFVCTEPYGKLTLELPKARPAFAASLSGSRVTFSQHLAAERDVKGWLLNGSHWLIALTAFRETNGNPDVKLNTFITESIMHRYYAGEIITEMRQGVEALLRADPTYAAFLHDTDITAYLDNAAASILMRFASNEDSIVRILRRFRAPSVDDVGAVQTFVDSLLQKIERPLHAYGTQYGAAPRASTEALMNVLRLQATATYPNPPANAQRLG
jgi:hypothetical protein